MNVRFSDAEMEFLMDIGVTIDYDNMTDDDFLLVEEKVSLYLQQHGFDEKYKPTQEGLICENILGKL